MENKIDLGGYQNLVSQISETYTTGYQRTVTAINSNMIETYWKIGQHVVEFEQGGMLKAEYGKALLTNLSKDLSLAHGKGFSLSNIYMMRLFFIRYPIFQTVSGKFDRLSWSHFCELIPINDELERQFYEIQTQNENWNVRELKRQKKSSLFLRLAASKDKADILQLSQKGQIIEHAKDIIREPAVLEFLKIPEPYHLSESELESRLIDHLQEFLLELGKRICFYRTTIPNNLRKYTLLCRFGFLSSYPKMLCAY